jgi:hypothetical protein
MWLSEEAAMNYVWRVENDNGEGPYNTEWAHVRELRDDHNGDPEHPSPFRDFDVDEYDAFCAAEDEAVFGFRTKELALKWFETWLERLEQHGFRLKRFRTDEVIAESDRQLVFYKAA